MRLNNFAELLARKSGRYERKWTLVGHNHMITESERPTNSKLDGFFYLSIFTCQDKGLKSIKYKKEEFFQQK